MSRLDIMTPSRAQTVIDGLYRDVERRIAASPPGLCPVDLAKSFLDLCHAQTCGKCVPCRIGLGQLSELMEQVLEGEATMETISIIERVARVIVNSADCAIGRDAARLVLDGVQGFRDDYEEHILRHRCLGGMREPVPCVALCPAGVDIPGYLVLIKYGRYADAVRLIRKDNPFPSACAYICEHPCEARCRRNMIDDAVNIRGLKRYAVDNAGYVPQPDCAEPTGKKVAVIGISTPESFVKSTPTYFQDKDGNYIYTFAEGNNGQDLYDSVQKTIDAAKKDGADYVVAVAHLGIDESSEPWRSTDVIANTTGIDAMLDGHDHLTLTTKVSNKDGKDVILSSTGTKLNNLGKLTISADGKLHSELISDLEIEKDAKTKEVVDKIVAEFQTLLNKVVAHTDVDLTTQNPEGTARAIRNRETNLGDLCADAYRVTRGADIAIVNGGGIRKQIEAGDITLDDIYSVHPFGNTMCVIRVTGQQVLDALEWGARAVPSENGGFLQVSGLTYEIHTGVASSAEKDENGMFTRVSGEYRVKNVMVGGQPLELDKTYTLASHNYMLLGHGDGYTMFDGCEVLGEDMMVDNQVLITYITTTLGGVVGEQYANPYGDGRIVAVE